VPHHPATRSSRLALWLAWLAIIAVVGGVALATWFDTSTHRDTDRMVASLQLRSALGLRELGMGGGLAGIEQTFSAGSLHERAAGVVLAGELRGAEAARGRIDGLEADITSEQAQGTDVADDLLAAQILRQLYAGDDIAAATAALPDSAKERLQEQYGWTAELALHPESGGDAAARARLMADAKRTAIANLVVVVLGAGGVLLGAALFILFVVRVRFGSVGAGYEPEDGPAGSFIETFAVWLLVFTGLTTLSEYVTGDRGGVARILGVFVAQVISLGALWMPRRRGVAWPAIKQRLGLHLGKGFWREAGVGVVSYVGMLPLIAIGAVLAVLLQKAGAPTAGHPIVGLLGEGPVMVATVIVTGAVAAPIVEEILFRGALYHHLRSMTRRRSVILSVLISATFSGVIFAAIHPQGVAGLPALAAIGFGLALIREWRGSLVAPIVAHACLNSVTFAIALVAL